MGFDMLFILALAMLIFGPKKLPEISRTIGKFMAEFRRAGFEFKSQIEDEVRKLEVQADEDKRKQTSESSATNVNEPPQRQIMPPSVGETVGMRRPNIFHDDSFDSAVSGENANGNREVQNLQENEAETMRGPNA